MSCAHAYVPDAGGEGIFSIDASHLTFGRGALAEVGALAKQAGCTRVALFTDVTVAKLEAMAVVRKSMQDAGISFEVYDACRVEPTDESFLEASKFAAEGKFDGYVSLGGGSVIDTAKAASLYATYPAEFLHYVNAPVGKGTPVPGPLPPHIACPTTSGTGSEMTGIAVCDVLALHAKTGIASRRLRPTLAVVDPNVTGTLPGSVVAASGFDVLCHALESLTARPYVKRKASASPAARPMSQGANPWSDLGAREALRLGGQFLVRAVNDASDSEAREQLMWAATLAGIAFGNAGVHIPHAMAYGVAGNVRDFHMPHYPDHEPMVPHGVSVIVNAPATFRWTASTFPELHLDAAQMLGADVKGAAPSDAGEVLGNWLAHMMEAASVPVTLGGLGYREEDIAALVKGSAVQRRLLDNAPLPVAEAELETLFRATL